MKHALPANSWSRSFGRTLTAAFVVAMFAIPLASPARAAEPTSDEILQLHEAAQSPARVEEALSIARRLLANDPPASYLGVLRQLMLQAMVRANAPAKDIIALTDTLDTILDDRSRAMVLGQVSQSLMARGEAPEGALRLARIAYNASPATNDYIMRDQAAAIFGRALLQKGDADSARTLLESADAAPESASVLYHLGRAYEMRGENTRAIDAYIRSIGVFPAEDSSALPALRELYRKEHRNLKGLDERIASARKASKAKVALDGHRYIKDVPEWRAPNPDGKIVTRDDFRGKVVVMDFWGTWCGPCRMELPIVQRVYDRFKDRVAFIGINWERHARPEVQKERAMDYMAANALKFPIAFDQDYSVSNAFEVQAFPTMLMIDRTGKIQYRNVGVEPSIEKVMIAQIEDLLETPAGK